MKTKKSSINQNRNRIFLILFASIISLFIGVSSLSAQFLSGSDETDGALDITVDTTVDLDADGIFHHTTINVAEGATLTFNANDLNTPIHLLATGNVLIEGTIDVRGKPGTSSPPTGGKGGPGGFDGGDPGIIGAEPGDGHGPGGGKAGDSSSTSSSANSAGAGAYGTVGTLVSPNDGIPYGSPLLVPIVGGAGGGGLDGQPGQGGSGGGGAILIASDTEIEIASAGTINAKGGSNLDPNRLGQGSGGGIRLVSPLVKGVGILNAEGGSFSTSFGGSGRIRIDTLDKSQISFDFQPLNVVSIGAFMAVFPTPTPRLDIIEAAGQAISEGAGSSVSIFLDFGTSPNQTVVVQARDFTGIVPIAVVLVPENGPSTEVQDQIDMSEGNPAQTTVDVVVPLNTRTAIYAWTITP